MTCREESLRNINGLVFTGNFDARLDPLASQLTQRWSITRCYFWCICERLNEFENV